MIVHGRQFESTPRKRTRLALRVLVISVQLAAWGTVQAGSWQLVPRFSSEETYTDNVRQTENDRDGDFITSVSPGVSVRGESARLETNIDYNWRQQFYADETSFDRNNHQLQADIAATGVENWLYFDLNSRISQQSSDVRRFQSLNNRGRNNQLSDVTSLDLAPRIEHSFGSLGEMRLGYAHQIVNRSRAGGDPGADFGPGFNIANGSSVEDSVNLDLQSGSITGRMPVQLQAKARDLKFESGRDRKFRSVQTNVSYIVDRQFKLKGTSGYDSNTYDSRQGQASGLFWTAGGSWTPSARTSLDFDWGHRYFGRTIDVKARHTRRRWLFDFSYGTSLRTANQFERDLILVPLTDADGLPVFDPVTSGQILVPVDSPNATDDVFIETRASGGLTYTMRRGSLNLRYFEAKRESDTVTDTNRTRGVSFNLRRNLRPRLHADMAAMWRNNKQGALGPTSASAATTGNYYSIYPSVSYELGPHTTARFQYELTINNGASGFGLTGTSASPNFYENAFTASLAFHL